MSQNQIMQQQKKKKKNIQSVIPYMINEPLIQFANKEEKEKTIL